MNRSHREEELTASRERKQADAEGQRIRCRTEVAGQLRRDLRPLSSLRPWGEAERCDPGEPRTLRKQIKLPKAWNTWLASASPSLRLAGGNGQF